MRSQRLERGSAEAASAVLVFSPPLCARCLLFTTETQGSERSVHPITSAFVTAAAELGFSFEPYISLDLGGTGIQTLGLVRNFGSEKGTLLFARDGSPDPAIRARLTAEGYFSSELFADYETYERDLFTATLDDWQWFGAESSRPAWYSGNRRR